MSGCLFVFSGPSGVGKGTIIKRVLEELSQVHLAVSATTRPARPGETHGREYFFISEHQFDQMVKDDQFLEYCQVHRNRYGTLKSEVLEYQEKGISVILEIDVKGKTIVEEKVRNVCSIFVEPPHFSDLLTRLELRNTEASPLIEERLRIAKEELAAIEEYDYIVINDELNKAVSEVLKIIAEFIDHH